MPLVSEDEQYREPQAEVRDLDDQARDAARRGIERGESFWSGIKGLFGSLRKIHIPKGAKKMMSDIWSGQKSGKTRTPNWNDRAKKRRR